MDLLIEKDGKRTYLSRYKVITTSFEESSPSVKRNNTQIQYRNGNVDFGGWNETKTIDYVGYYRADDLEDEEYLRERIYALLSDPEGYYITQLKNDNDNSFERPGETSGDYFDKQVNRPSHKRFYVYASSLESELVGSYGGHVLYKISATFTTMKLPYGESVPRDLDVKPNVPYIGTNFITNSNFSSGLDHWVVNKGTNSDCKATVTTDSDGDTCVHITGTGISCGLYRRPVSFDQNQVTTGSVLVKGTGTVSLVGLEHRRNSTFGTISIESYSKVGSTAQAASTTNVFCVYFNPVDGVVDVYIKFVKLEVGSHATDWSPSPSDPGYNEWYLNTYYNTDNLVVPYAGTVPCNQLEQGFTVEFTAKESGSSLAIDLNGTELTYSGSIVSDDVFKLSGYEYTKNDISIVKDTNKAYFKLLPGVANKISSSLAGEIRILDYQDLYA